MSYPVTPWYLQGRALLSAHWIDVDRARSEVPPALEIQSVLPGKTLGCVLLARYETGSVLEYSELIVVPALVKHEGQLGGWISPIYVDDVSSVNGGRDIWGLPKQLAEFAWTEDTIEVSQQGRLLCGAARRSRWFSLPNSWQLPITGQVFCQRKSELALFKSRVQGQTHIASTQLTVPPTSPFAHLALEQPWLEIELTDLKLTVEEPHRLSLIP